MLKEDFDPLVHFFLELVNRKFGSRAGAKSSLTPIILRRKVIRGNQREVSL